MTNSPFSQELAAYALDILEEQAEFENELAASVELQAELAAFQAAVGDLAYGVPEVPLPAGLKSKLFDRINLVSAKPADLLELMDWSISELQQVAKDLANWEPFPMPSGSKMVIWQVDTARSQVAFFLRVPGAGKLPEHWHATGESILVLEGDYMDENGTVYGVGDRSLAPANTSHQPTTSMGCLVLVVTSTNDKILALTA